MTRTCKYCGCSLENVALKNIYCSRSCSAHISRNKRHGLSLTREYATWTAMRERCSNPKAHNYPLYGARGIRICERWSVYENFIADMGPRPKGCSIERIDNDGNYEPSNCKWATKLEQNRNRRTGYTAEQDQTIKDGISRGLSFPEIAKLMSKSTSAVSTRAYRIGLSSGWKSAMSPAERS